MNSQLLDPRGKAGRWASIPGTPMFVLSWASPPECGKFLAAVPSTAIDCPGCCDYKLSLSRGRSLGVERKGNHVLLYLATNCDWGWLYSDFWNLFLLLLLCRMSLLFIFSWCWRSNPGPCTPPITRVIPSAMGLEVFMCLFKLFGLSFHPCNETIWFMT